MVCKSTVAPAMNLNVRGVTDQTIDLAWEGSVMVTDFLVTYTPSGPGGKYESELNFQDKGHASLHFSLFCCVLKDKKKPASLYQILYPISYLSVRCAVRDKASRQYNLMDNLRAGSRHGVQRQRVCCHQQHNQRSHQYYCLDL